MINSTEESTEYYSIAKSLIFACKMYNSFPTNREKYRFMAQTAVAKLEKLATTNSDVFTAWKIGLIALDQMV